MMEDAQNIQMCTERQLFLLPLKLLDYRLIISLLFLFLDYLIVLVPLMMDDIFLNLFYFCYVVKFSHSVQRLYPVKTAC